MWSVCGQCVVSVWSVWGQCGVSVGSVFTCEGPVPVLVDVAAVVDEVGVEARAVRRLLLEERPQLRLDRAESEAAGRVVAAVVVYEVVGEETLHGVEDVSGSLTQLLHGTSWKHCDGIARSTTDNRQDRLVCGVTLHRSRHMSHRSLCWVTVWPVKLFW